MTIKAAKAVREANRAALQPAETFYHRLLNNMNFIPFLVSLSVMVAAAARRSNCDGSCKYVTKDPWPYVKHLTPELQNNSVAPWSYRNSSEEGRLPETILFAVCKTCSVENMVARSISLQIPVFKRHHSDKGWCKCHYELAVGCTCVMKQ